jgi:hypothetical protein
MGDDRNTLDYGRPAARDPFPWQVVAAIPLIFFAPATICACGHMDWLSLAFTGPAAGLAWWGLCRSSRAGIWVALVLFTTVLATLVLAKNMADILWFGHHALLRR